MLNGNEFLMIWKVGSLPLGLPCPRPLFQPQAECFLHHIRPQWASISSHHDWSPLATATSFLWYSFHTHQTRSSCAYDFILSSVSSNFPARHRLLSSPLWLPGCLHDTKSNCLCLIAPIGKSTDQEPELLRLLLSCRVHNQTYLVNERMIYIPLPFHQLLFPVSMKALRNCIIHQSAHLLAHL